MTWPARPMLMVVVFLAVLATPAGAFAAEPGIATAPGPAAAVPMVVDCGGVPLLAQPACYAAGLVGDTAGAVTGAVTGAVGGVGGQLAGGLGDAALSALTNFVVGGAVWFLGQVADVVTRSTELSVTAGWFTARYRVMAALAGSLTVLFVLLAALAALIARDPRRLIRPVAMIPAAGLGTFAAVAVTRLLLAVSDQMSAAVSRGLTGDLREALTGAAHGLGTLTLVGGGPVVPAFATMLAGLLAAVAAVVIWLELLLREVAIYATLLFFPIGLAGLVWDGSRRWAGRLTEILCALIFAKFVIVAVLSLAVGGLASGREGYGGVLLGAALLVVAAFAPFLLLRIIGVLEVAAAATALEGVRQRGMRPVLHGGQSALRAVQRGVPTGAGRVTVAGGGMAAAGGAAAGGAAVASTVGRAAGRTASRTVTAATTPNATPTTAHRTGEGA